MTFELETAIAPEKLRRVAIDPVSRVEGHGKVTILLDDDNKVHQVRLRLSEGDPADGGIGRLAARRQPPHRLRTAGARAQRERL